MKFVGYYMSVYVSLVMGVAVLAWLTIGMGFTIGIWLGGLWMILIPGISVVFAVLMMINSPRYICSILEGIEYRFLGRKL